MKKLIALILSALMLSACGTADNETSEQTQPTETTTTITTTTAATVETTTTAAATTTTAEESTAAETTTQTAPPAITYDPDELPELLKQNFPRMDGSTSTIPMDVAIRQAILGEDYFTAVANTRHSTTYGSLNNMFYDLNEAEDIRDENGARIITNMGNNRQVDVLLSVDYEQERLDTMTQYCNADFVKTPIAKEALVFLVNKSNPVESISSEDLKKIYSGEITNWKELGGEDAEIKAFQRNSDSGSQTAMVQFMAGADLTAAETELIVSAMGPLVDEVANFDSGVNSIGYSVFSFAAKQYANTENIKFIAVDDVPPADETIGDGSYPIIDYTYVYYNRNNPESKLRGEMLTQWLLTDDGQTAIRNANYINLNGDPPPQNNVAVISAKGTGKAKPADFTVPTYGYVMNNLPTRHSGDGEETIIPKKWPGIFINSDAAEEIVFPEEENGRRHVVKGVYPELMGLSNTAVQQKINAAMKSMIQSIEDDNFYMMDNIGFHIYSNEYDYSGSYYATGITGEYIIKNGYFSVMFHHETMSDYQTAVFDLRTGEQLNFTDLFYAGEDFADKLNQSVNNTIQTGAYGRYTNELKTPFVGLEEGQFGFTLNKIIFYKTGSYYNYYMVIPVDYPSESFVPAAPDDMADVFTPAAQDYYGVNVYGVYADDWQDLEDDRFIQYALFAKNANLDEDKREQLNALITDFVQNDAVAALDKILPADWRDYLNNGENELPFMAQSSLTVITPVYYPGNVLSIQAVHANDFGEYGGRFSQLFDADTLEPITDVDEIFVDGWADSAKWTDKDAAPIPANTASDGSAIIGNAQTESFTLTNYREPVLYGEYYVDKVSSRFMVTMTFGHNGADYTMQVPVEMLKGFEGKTY
jgi:ABC-type phosphate transport system substrate-binding protein